MLSSHETNTEGNVFWLPVTNTEGNVFWMPVSQGSFVCVCVCVCARERVRASGCRNLRTVTRHYSHWWLGNVIGNLWTLKMAVCIHYDVGGWHAPWRLCLQQDGGLCLNCHDLLRFILLSYSMRSWKEEQPQDSALCSPILHKAQVGTKFGLNLAFHSHREFRPAL
jgi:hypothetical protein